ncbi:MAG: oligoendopeptidase F [Candidatus Aminicenantes bacterium]|nr:oligoendopeptidase F [Candidatus Aminicenantes bacterium]
MKKENKIEIPDYSHEDRGQVPGEFKWKVEDTYANLEEWQKDKALLLKMIPGIKKRARGWTSAPGKMFDLLDHLDQMDKKENRLYLYTSLLADTDMGNSMYQAMKGKMQTIDVELNSMLTFIDPDILKLGKEKIREYIAADPRLKVYQHKFDSVLRMEKHILPHDKEEIVARTGLFSGAPGKASGMLNNLDMPSPEATLSTGEKIRLNIASFNRFRGVENRRDRRLVMRTFWNNHANFKHTHAALLDAEIKKHFFHARVHHYKDCLHAALFPQNIHPDVYHTLVHTVKENLAPFHRYLKLKARLLKLERIDYNDIYASSVPEVDRFYSIREAQDITLEAMKPLGNEYIAVLKKGFDNGWMDIYPNKGKRSGAYSNGSFYDGHPYVLMNFNGSFDHISTLAHEFGHALHSWFSNRVQPFPLSQYPIFLAEIASTFNETLLVHHLLKTETDDLLKLYILDQYIESFRGTLFRQVLFADFELALHRAIEKGQTLTPGWLDKKYLRLTRLYYGHQEGILKVDKYIENEWSAVPHFYYNFYVYQYSTGIIAATALAHMVLNGGKIEQNRCLDFLKSGGSKYPLDTLKDAGVDLTTPQPIELALSRFNQVVEEMESIAGRVQMGKVKGEIK